MWTRRRLIETVAVGATGVALTAAHHASAQVTSGAEPEHNDAMWKTCCDVCASCAKACNKMFHHCLMQAASGKGQQHLQMAQIAADCAEFCGLSSKLLGRTSTLAMLSCTACADACKRCAQECDSFETDLEMKMCSQECLRCEESCRKMVKEGGGSATGASIPTRGRTSPRAN